MNGEAIAATDTTGLATGNDRAGLHGAPRGEIAALGDRLTWRLVCAGRPIVDLDVTLLKLLP